MKACKEKFMKLFCEAVCPSDQENLYKTLIDDSNNLNESLKILKESINDDKSKKNLIGGIANIPNIKRQQLKLIGMSDYDIKKARRLFSNGPQEKTKNRFKLDVQKADHFIAFLFSSGLLIDSPTKTTTIRMSNGQSTVVPKPVAITAKNIIINEYKAECNQTNFNPLSDPTLYKIIDSVKPSFQKCLSGLNGTIVFGEEAFKWLSEAVRRWIPTQSTSESKFEEKLIFYLDFMKISHPKHVSIESNVWNHCATFGVSNMSIAEFQNVCHHEHNKWCSTCEGLFQLLDEIEITLEKNVNENEIDQIMFDFARYKDNVENWVKQNLQNCIQEPSKISAFDEIKDNENSAVLIRDWAMKFLPQKFHENQSFFFGKAGMSLHMDCLFYYVNGVMCKTTYITCISICKQDVADTLSVLKQVLLQMTKG